MAYSSSNRPTKTATELQIYSNGKGSTSQSSSLGGNYFWLSGGY